MTELININTPGGDMSVTKSWVKSQLLSKTIDIKEIGQTYFIYDNHTWSISKKDLDSIFIELRDDKINIILSHQNLSEFQSSKKIS